MKGKIIKTTVFALLLLLLGGLLAYKYITAPLKQDEVRVSFPADTSRRAMRDSLDKSIGPLAGRVAAMYGLMSKAEAPHGSFAFSHGTSALQMAKTLARNRQTPIRLTFSNIRTMAQLAQRVGERMEMSANQFLAACSEVLPAAGFKPAEFIAAFLPDTYEFYWTETPQRTVERLLEVRNRFWDDFRRAQAKALGLTPVEVQSLCAIAEEESNKADERPVIARLYYNRLRKGMRLQADPTVKFALGDFSLRRILAKHLKVDSPYNTYRTGGLPPGPIRMPERTTIDNFLNAPANNYIYMCAREDFSGYHNFTASWAEHQANAKRYRNELKNRNIQ